MHGQLFTESSTERSAFILAGILEAAVGSAQQALQSAMQRNAMMLLWQCSIEAEKKSLIRVCYIQDLDTVVARKKRRSVNKSNVRPIGNASIEVLQKRRAEKPEQRKASREAALRYACVFIDLCDATGSCALCYCVEQPFILSCTTG